MATSESLAVVSDNYEAMIANELEPDRAFLMPRPIPTPAGVIFQHGELSKNVSLAVSAYGGVIARPSAYRTLSYCTAQTNAMSGTFNAQASSYDGYPTTNLLCWLCPDLRIGKDEYIQPTISYSPPLAVSGAYVTDQNGDDKDNLLFAPSDAMPYWNGCWTMASPALTFKTTQTVGGNITLNCTPYTLRGGSWSSGTPSGVLTLNANSITDIAFSQPSTDTTIEGTAILCNFVFPSALVSTGFSFNVTQKAAYTSPGTQLNYVWKDLSIFDIVGNEKAGVDTLKEQYDRSARHCVTGFSCRVTNTTPTMFQGGSIAAAQLQGDTSDDLPQNPRDLKSFLASRNDGKTYTGTLKKGAHYSYIPEKMQDLFFVRTGTDESRDDFHLPYGAIAWEASTVDDVDAVSLLITVKMNLELLTTDLSVTKFEPTQDLGQVMEVVIMLMQLYNPCSENPDHMKKVKDIARGIVRHPMFKKVVSELIKAGVRVAPTLLALL